LIKNFLNLLCIYIQKQMGIYSIDPKTKIDANNTLNIMTQLLLEISNSIQSIYNIIDETSYVAMINNLNDVLNNYLKIYNYYGYGITNMYVQIYNQNVELVAFVNIKLNKHKYVNLNSYWNDFVVGIYNNETKIIYQELTQDEKDNLRCSIVSGNLYFIDNVQFVYNGENMTGILIKPKINNCDCGGNNTLGYSYISTIYWN